MNTLFFDLTPEVIIKAVERLGYELTGHCMALNSYENRVYDLKLKNDTHIVTKFYRPGRWTLEQIQEEHSFIFELQKDEIPVCAPVIFPDNESVHETEGIYYAVWPRTGGRSIDEFSDQQLQILGHLIARMHNTAAAKKTQYRRSLTGDTYGRKPLQFLLEKGFLPEHCKARYANAVNEIADIYDKLSKDIPSHRIHGDCHQGNLLNGEQGMYFLDFDDFLVGPAVQDIWMLVPVTDREGLRQREVLLDAYRQFRDFDSAWLRLVEPLRALRYIHYAAWIARRWEDPSFPKIFPHFGSDAYWEDETADLEKQLELIQTFEQTQAHLFTHNTPEISNEEDELSNSDFFWDWEE